MRTAKEHLDTILDELKVAQRERVPLAEAVGLVLAEDVTAAVDLPGFDNSSMDGYAVQAASLEGADREPVELRIVGELAAGVAGEVEVGPGEAARIMTGAPLPAGADAVIPVEQTDGAADGVVTCRAAVAPGQFVRRRGEDVRAGTAVAWAGNVVGPRTVALIAASGHAECVVHRRPHVIVVPTGDELVPPGEPLAPGQIHDSNSTMLQAAAVAAGATAEILPAVGDDDDALIRALDEAMGRADAIVTTGGVSMGAYDVVKSALKDKGVDFVSVAMQPGKPQGFGHVIESSTRRRVPLFALPGNPVSSYVSFEVFVRPALRRLMGLEPEVRPVHPALITTAMRSPAGREQFARAVVTRDAAGHLVAEPVAGQGSHFIADLSRANALLVIPAAVTTVAAGDQVEVVLLDGEVCS